MGKKKIEGNLSELDIPPLNEKQGTTLISLANEIMLGGAVFGGKSHLLRVSSIIYAAMVPGINIYLFRRLTRDLVLNHMHGAYSYHTLLQPWVESGYVQIINSAPHEIRFGNGSRIFLNHCQYLHNVYSFQGAEIHVLLIDEATHFLPEMYQFLRSRVRLGGLTIDFQNVTDVFNSMLENWGLDARFTVKQMKNYFPKIILGTNPGNVGHTYFKEKFVDAAPPFKIWKTSKEEGGMYRQFIPAVYTDNEYGMKLDPNYIDRVRGLSDPKMAEAMIEGDWNIISGGALSDVWDEAIHFIEPFEIPETWYVDRTHDWGSAAPFVTVWFAESNGDSAKSRDGTILNFPPGTLFIIDELYGGKADDLSKGLELSSFEIGERIAKKELAMGESERIKAGPADSSIFDLTKFRNEYTSIHEEIKHGYNSIYYKEKKRKRGELFIPADKSPGSRIRGLEVLRTLLKSSKKEIMEEKGLFVFNHCLFFKKTVPNLQRSSKNPEDVDTDSVDHYYDAVRYRVLTKKTEIKKLSNYL